MQGEVSTSPTYTSNAATSPQVSESVQSTYCRDRAGFDRMKNSQAGRKSRDSSSSARTRTSESNGHAPRRKENGVETSKTKKLERDSNSAGRCKVHYGKTQDEDSLQMFLSTDNMQREEEYHRRKERSGGRKVIFPTQYSEESKKKRESIVRQILDDFDLEETKDKYRNFSACEHRRHGKSLADYRFRSELIRMMGSEVIRLSDQHWSRRLQEKLREDYERQLDEQEYNLAEAERQRMRRLQLEGIIRVNGSDNTRSKHPCGSAHGIHDGAPSSASSNRKSSQKQRNKDHQPIFMKEEYNQAERQLFEQRHFQMYRPKHGMQQQMDWVRNEVQVDDNTGKEMSQGLPAQKIPEELVTPSPDTSLPLASMSQRISTDREGEPTGVYQKRKKQHRNLPPDVARLYEVETVSGLYQLAHKLIGKVTQSDKDQ